MKTFISTGRFHNPSFQPGMVVFPDSKTFPARIFSNRQAMTLLLTGAAGQVGSRIHDLALKKRIDIVALDRQALDLTEEQKIAEAFQNWHPSLVVNTAAYTAVDRAESEPAMAMAVNRDGAIRLATHCALHGIPLIHLSTDYVFDGNKKGTYDEDDAPSPLGVYGQTKWEGEEGVRKALKKHLILRVSWIFGENGSNFVKTILRLAMEREILRVVDDQRGCPTPAESIATAILELRQRIEKGNFQDWGTYHYCGTPAVTWYQFALAILRSVLSPARLMVKEIIPVRSDEYPTKASRPKNTVLNTAKIRSTLGIEPPFWTDSLPQVVSTFLS